MTSWFFIEMAAKSALICGIALLLAKALRNRAAADRATVLRVGAGLLVALPLIDIAFPVLQIEAFAAPAASLANLSAAELDQLLALAASAPPVEPTIWDDPTPLILILWAAGALAVLAQLAVGLVTLDRWTRDAEPATDPHWLQALERARAATGAPDRLLLMVSDKVPGPLGWGYRKPVILIDYDSYAERVEADAILAHEVAHVARCDWPALMMTRLATALFWFNPLVWTLARESIQQAEEAADAHAARTVDPASYAETLLSWGQIGRGIGVPANSIAPGARALSRRVRAVLDARLRERSARSHLAVVAVLLCVGIAAPVAALELVEASRPQAEHEAPGEPVLAAAQIAEPQSPRAPKQPDAARAPEAPGGPELREIEIAPAIAEMREVLPRVPEPARKSLQHVNPEEIARAIRESNAAARMSAEDMHAALAHARAAMRHPHPEAMRVHVKPTDPKELEARIRAHMPGPEEVQRRVRAAMREHRTGMEHGARGMEQGAAQMEAQARRFRDHDERERIIARERERGRTVTHEQLLRIADGLAEGARDLRKGAAEMRRSLD